MKILKNFFLNEFSTLRTSVGKLEYLSWWLLRIAMVGSFIYQCNKDAEFIVLLLIGLNLLATFTVPLMRLILLPKRVLKKLPFRCQSWLNIMIFFGNFLSQGVGLLHIIPDYDKYLHIVAGVVLLFLGNKLLEMFMAPDDKMSPLLRTFSATGFSFFTMVIWEIFEFIVDYYWPLSSNQAYNTRPNESFFLLKLMGPGAQNENQWAVYDTNIDMLCAVIGTVIAAVILLVILYKKQNKALPQKQEATV